MSHGERSKEPIDWASDDLKAKSGAIKKKPKSKKLSKGEKPGAKYGSISEALRQTMSPKTTCAMFCGGKKCKYELATPWKDEEQAIKGIYSNWITDNILAMARPNTEGIEKHQLIEQFHENGINSIINLQLPGEHSSCGNALEDGGFSYLPQTFMDNNIFFYNFGWPDYSVGSLANILDMVKVMQFALSEGKVAIHCHAGLGRTGVLIACYLVFANRMSSHEVVNFIRSKRPPSIQTRSQLVCIDEFTQYLQPLRVVFSSVVEKAYDFTLQQFLIRQKHLLHGFEARRLKHTPKIIDKCCSRVLELANLVVSQHHSKDTFKIMKETASSAFNNRGLINSPMKNDVSDTELQNTGRRKLNRKLSISMESFSPLNTAKTSGSSGQKSPEVSQSSSSQSGVDSESENTADSSKDGKETMTYRRSDSDRTTANSVAREMATTEYSEETLQKVKQYKMNLNEDVATWTELEGETDVSVLSCLMWDWMDHLKEPVLHIQDLPHMLEYTDDPIEGLNVLNKGSQHTVLKLFETVAALEPLQEKTEMELVQRVLSILTHQNMVLEMDPILTPAKSLLKRTSNDTGLMRDNVANRMMVFFLHLIKIQMDKLEALQKAVSNGEKESRPGRSSKGHGRPTSAKGRTRVTPEKFSAGTAKMKRERKILEEDQGANK